MRARANRQCGCGGNAEGIDCRPDLEDRMRLVRSGKDLVVTLSAEAAARRGLAEGDEVELVRSSSAAATDADDHLTREEALERLKAFAAQIEWPTGDRFKRDDAYEERLHSLAGDDLH